MADPQHAPTATMDIILTPALLTATTDLAGSRAAYSSVPAHGMAGDAHGVGAEGAGAMAAVGAMVATVGASTVATVTMADVGLPADEGTRMVRLAASTVVVDTAAADTANLGRKILE